MNRFLAEIRRDVQRYHRRRFGDHGTTEERGTGEHRVQKDESVPVNSRTDAESSASGKVPDKEEVSVFESQPKGAQPPRRGARRRRPMEWRCRPSRASQLCRVRTRVAPQRSAEQKRPNVYSKATPLPEWRTSLRPRLRKELREYRPFSKAPPRRALQQRGVPRKSLRRTPAGVDFRELSHQIVCSSHLGDPGSRGL